LPVLQEIGRLDGHLQLSCQRTQLVCNVGLFPGHVEVVPAKSSIACNGTVDEPQVEVPDDGLRPQVDDLRQPLFDLLFVDRGRPEGIDVDRQRMRDADGIYYLDFTLCSKP
jgi:hypothetical protein